MKKKQNLNRDRNMDVDVWRDRQIKLRLKEHLDKTNREFAGEFGGLTDEELRERVRRRAEVLRSDRKCAVYVRFVPKSSAPTISVKEVAG